MPRVLWNTHTHTNTRNNTRTFNRIVCLVFKSQFSWPLHYIQLHHQNISPLFNGHLGNLLFLFCSMFHTHIVYSIFFAHLHILVTVVVMVMIWFSCWMLDENICIEHSACANGHTMSTTSPLQFLNFFFKLNLILSVNIFEIVAIHLITI